MLVIPVRKIVRVPYCNGYASFMVDNRGDSDWIRHSDIHAERHVNVIGCASWCRILVSADLLHYSAKRMYRTIYDALRNHIASNLYFVSFKAREQRSICSATAKRITHMLLCEGVHMFRIDEKVYAVFNAPMFAPMIEVECPIDFGD